MTMSSSRPHPQRRFHKLKYVLLTMFIAGSAYYLSTIYHDHYSPKIHRSASSPDEKKVARVIVQSFPVWPVPVPVFLDNVAVSIEVFDTESKAIYQFPIAIQDMMIDIWKQSYKITWIDNHSFNVSGLHGVEIVWTVNLHRSALIDHFE